MYGWSSSFLLVLLSCNLSKSRPSCIFCLEPIGPKALPSRKTPRPTRRIWQKGQFAHKASWWECDHFKVKVWGKMHCDWLFAFLAMWFSVLLATTLLALRYVFEFPKSLPPAPRRRRRPRQRRRPANQVSARRAKKWLRRKATCALKGRRTHSCT